MDVNIKHAKNTVNNKIITENVVLKETEMKNINEVILFLRIKKQDENKYLQRLTMKTESMEKVLLHDVVVTVNDKFIRELEKYEIWRQGETSKYDPRFPETLNDQIIFENMIGVGIYHNFFAEDLGKIFESFMVHLKKRRIERLLLVISSPEPEILNIPFAMMRKDANTDPFCLENEGVLFTHTTECNISKFEIGSSEPLARAYPKRSGEHEVHPYLKPERLCRGESRIRLYYPFAPFQAFSDKV